MPQSLDTHSPLARRSMERHCAGTAQSPLKQKRIKPAEITGYRWKPADSQRHSKKPFVVTAAVNVEFTVYILNCICHNAVNPSAALAFYLFYFKLDVNEFWHRLCLLCSILATDIFCVYKGTLTQYYHKGLHMYICSRVHTQWGESYWAVILKGHLETLNNSRGKVFSTFKIIGTSKSLRS